MSSNEPGRKPKGIDDLYPPKWVIAADLNGKAVSVKIARVDVETFHVPQINEKKTAAVLAFEGKSKRLILNKTQCRALSEIAGSGEFADWTGQWVALSAAKAPNGKPTIAIGPGKAPAKSKKPPATTAPQSPSHWFDDPAQRETFELTVVEFVLKEQQVAEALGVPEVRDFTGTLEEALDALGAYDAELATAAFGPVEPEEEATAAG